MKQKADFSFSSDEILLHSHVVIKVNSRRKYNVVNYDNNYHHRQDYGAFMEATREKLLSGKNKFRNENENDLLCPFVTFAFFALCGHNVEPRRMEKNKKNHFIMKPLLFSHLNGELLIEVKVLICCLSGTSVNDGNGPACVDPLTLFTYLANKSFAVLVRWFFIG